MQSEPTKPATCLIFGYFTDIAGDPIEGVTVNFVPVGKGYAEASEHVVTLNPISVMTKANGYFEQPIIRSSQFENTNVTVKLTYSYKGKKVCRGSSGSLTIDVPDQDTLNITSLLTA